MTSELDINPHQHQSNACKEDTKATDNDPASYLHSSRQLLSPAHENAMLQLWDEKRIWNTYVVAHVPLCSPDEQGATGCSMLRRR